MSCNRQHETTGTPQISAFTIRSVVTSTVVWCGRLGWKPQDAWKCVLR